MQNTESERSRGIGFRLLSAMRDIYYANGNHLKCFMQKPIAQKTSVKKMIVSRKYEEYITQLL